MSGITVSRADDRLIAVKRATAESRARRLREAHLLARLDHPGVVQFVDLIDGESTELHMSYAGSDSWERQPPTSEAGIIEGLAAVASTVADLHDLGTAHRALIPEHVLVTADRRPVLCGLADADTADPVTCADDLDGLAGLIRNLSPSAPAELRNRLDTLATRASNGDLTARRLTDELNALRGPQRTARRWRPVLEFGRTSRVAVSGLAILLAAVAWGWNRTGDASSRAPVADPPATVTTITAAVRVAPPPPTSAPAAPATSLAAATTTTAAPLVLVHAGRRFGIGAQGDISLLGDWNCDGTATPALLQPSRSLVAIFSTWPEAGEMLEPAATTVVAGATGLQLVESDECDQLRVVHLNGSTLFAPDFT